MEESERQLVAQERGDEGREERELWESPQLLRLLLIDHSSGCNIIWATEHYAGPGEGYGFHDEITPEKIAGTNGPLIHPRVKKSTREKNRRSRDKGEVYTPAWVCNAQANLIDNAWFGEKDIFNRELEKGWETLARRIPFPSASGKTWQDYVRDTRLEITCGEAPYLVSRYDAVTGTAIPVEERVGLLDRKLRVVGENTDNREEWYEWARRAYCSTYGYEWQGDSLFLARKNLLLSYVEHFRKRWGEETSPLPEEIYRTAEIIAWNIWQMDGLKFVIPDTCHEEVTRARGPLEQGNVKRTPCPGCAKNDYHKHNGIRCVIRDWDDGGKVTPFVTLLQRQV